MNQEQTRLVELNRAEYGENYPHLRFITPAEAEKANIRRNALLARLQPHASVTWKGSKIFTGPLSPGCQLCGEGRWSCLFINGRCNCRCFYCPTSQEEIGLPTTNTVTFRTPAAYADYLERFALGGASLSGGEPLLTPGRALGFLTAIRQRLGRKVHLWLYTNGTLLDAGMVERLREAGLDEIRFDIGAVGYDLRQLALAVGRIPTVTVEIPAVPEDAGRLRQKIREMAELGVNHLNLHQLRLTPYSLPRFSERPYTYLHGEKVTVLESELLALELMAEAAEAGCTLPINYCSFVFKNRWQKVANRRRNGEFLRKSWEDLTESGLLRTLLLEGSAEAVGRQAERLQAAGVPPEQWALEGNGARLAFAAEIQPILDFAECRLIVSYSEAGQRAALSYRNPFREVKLAGAEKFMVERWKVGEEVLAGEEIVAFSRFLSGSPTGAPFTEKFSNLETMEQVPSGLQDYF
jgi:pyruvate formate-lyase activating enzyme-like uncharacterized protein